MNINTLKNIIFFTVLILFETTKLYSQDSNNSKGYLSYFGNDSTNINLTHVPCHSADLKYNISGVIYNHDTIRINGNLYMFRSPQYDKTPDDRRIDFYFPRYDTLFLREERETGRLFRYYRDYFGTGETEKIICDMTLNVGDKIIYPTGSYWNCLAEDSLVVYSVDIINDIKVIRLRASYYDATFREGIFPDAFPLWQEPLFSGEIGPAQWSKLLCIHKDGEQVYVNQSEGCYGSNPWSINEMSQRSISVYPNIIYGFGTITIESLNRVYDVSILDMFGKITKINANQFDDKTWQIDILNNFVNGIYLIITQTENGVFYEKIIVHN